MIHGRRAAEKALLLPLSCSARFRPQGAGARPMSVLVVTGLKKILGAQEVLRGVDLQVDHGEKVGIVGRNGEGKTTLLRLVEGEETPDGGTIQLARQARIGYVKQRPDFGPGVTVRAYVQSGLDEVHGVAAELERVAERMGEAAGEELDTLVKRHGELTGRMEFLGGWESERRVETVLSGIGLAEALWDREARTLSGGERSRTAMARELVSVPDLLLLDEPTNHLDLAGIEWLEGYLASIGSAALLVSHDRRLLDRVAGSILEVERGGLTRYPGNYSRYVELKEERYRSALRAWEQQQDEVRREEAFIKKHMGSQRTSEAKGRRKRLQSLERLERPYNDVRKPRIRVAQAERGGEQVLVAEGLAVGYGTPLLSGIELRIGRGERIGLIGPNGAGKTTLLRVLAGVAQPLAGTIARGYKAVCGYFDQDTHDLRDDGTPYEELRRAHPQMADIEIRSHLALFLFRGGDVDLPVRGLSGGERARLSLAKLVLTRPSWMALDEPTNHLDLAGRTALEEMLSEFPGSLVCVSHDRQFLDGLCNRIVHVGRGGIESFQGNYSEYRAHVAARQAAEQARDEERARKQRDVRRRAEETRVQAVAARPAAQRPGPPAPQAKKRNPWKLEQLEKEIMSLEERRDALVADMGTEEAWRDHERTRELQFELAEIERSLEEKNQEWESYA